MPTVASFRNDTKNRGFLISLIRRKATSHTPETPIRKCIVFPADGSETRVVHMIARTATQDDPLGLRRYKVCVDLATTFGDDLRQVRVMNNVTGQSTYLFFYNLSPNLPINLTIARAIGVTPSHWKSKKHPFWTGDVVAMKVQRDTNRIYFRESECHGLDADLSELGTLKDFFRETYQEGVFGRLLHDKESLWGRLYRSHYRGPSSLLFGASILYWGSKREEDTFFHDLNELRRAVGRPPLPCHVYMESYIFSTFKSLLCLPQKVTGPPNLPPELERHIFEICALENPGLCTVLVLVARRVHVWIDPILISTVYIMDQTWQRDRLKSFLAKLTNGKPVQYYVQHIKNLAILGAFSDNKEINQILAICAGVENLAVLTPTSFELFETPLASRHLRRLTIRLEDAFRSFGSRPNFYHACFSNLTHLHLRDGDKDWPTYEGWETLVSLTHLAFAWYGPPERTLPLIETLSSVQYVALGRYHNGERYKFAEATVNNDSHIRAAWGTRVVWLSHIPLFDWERGARGEADFWDLVEREVERRLKEGSVD